ncbi:MAG: site-specific integrase [Micrococcaceae bacterium]|nr:site-specific integrase [Micrococcaceae bacterium]
MDRQAPAGTASIHLVEGVAFLDEESSVFEAMIQGWCAQQLGGRRLQKATVENRVHVLRQFRDHAGAGPWDWTAAGFDEWMMDLVSVRHMMPSTLRTYQVVIRQFCDFICSSHYGWAQQCEERFGTHPIQVCHDWNTRPHLQDHEANPRRRPLTRGELQQLFDRADDEVQTRLTAGRKGAAAAYRDATLLKVVYAWGLRANEAMMLDTTDLYRNPKVPSLGDFGFLRVRYGKASRGSPPTPRTVVTVMPWSVDVLKDYIDNVLPLMRSGTTNALWFSERSRRLGVRSLSDRFALYRDELGMESSLSPHCLRHSYATHLIEDGHDPLFVQRQLGHAYQSTTGIYTHVSEDFANRILREALAKIPPLAGLT